MVDLPRPFCLEGAVGWEGKVNYKVEAFGLLCVNYVRNEESVMCCESQLDGGESGLYTQFQDHDAMGSDGVNGVTANRTVLSITFNATLMIPSPMHLVRYGSTPVTDGK